MKKYISPRFIAITLMCSDIMTQSLIVLPSGTEKDVDFDDLMNSGIH